MTGSSHTRRLAALLATLLVASGCSPGPSLAPDATARASPTAGPDAAASRLGSPAATTSTSSDPRLGTAIVPGAVDRSSLELTATYDVDLDITVGTGDLLVESVIEARNDSGGPIDRLELNTIAARLGGLEVTGANVDGRPADVTIDDQTLLIPLGGILPDGATTAVQLGYSARLRADFEGSNWLFSRAGGTLALYRWIPWVSRAVPFDRPNHGDPFVTSSSPLVRVRITADAPMVLASPVAVPEPAARSWSFEARDVRDVSLVLAPDFAVATGDAGGIAIRAFTLPGGLDGDRLVGQAANALTKMADRLDVMYPWATFAIVETGGGFGMESPGLIWIPSSAASANIPYLIHHETAHQWFYGLVGNDQQAEPFADEAPSDLLARSVLGQLRSSRCDPAPLDRAITGYSRACYYEVVYIQGANLLDDLRETMGADRFWSALSDYIDSNRTGLSGTQQLLDVLQAASPDNIQPVLRERFPSLY